MQLLRLRSGEKVSLIGTSYEIGFLAVKLRSQKRTADYACYHKPSEDDLKRRSKSPGVRGSLGVLFTIWRQRIAPDKDSLTMQGVIRLFATRTISFVALSAAVLISGCVTSAKVRKSTSCPSCQGDPYPTLKPTPATPYEDYQSPNRGGIAPEPLPPSPPVETTRRLPGLNNRPISPYQSADRDAKNMFD